MAAFVTLNLLKPHIAQISRLAPFREINISLNQPAQTENYQEGFKHISGMGDPFQDV